MNFALGQFMRRPEAGSILGLLGVVVFFVVLGGVDLGILLGAASWVNFAANLGIVAIPVGLLMMAGELDISVGAMIPAGSMTAAILSGYYELPIVVGMLGALGVGVLVGLVNGILTVRTSVPSLIITLGTLVAMQGIVLSASVLLTGNASVSLTAPDWAKFLFGQLIGGSHQVIIVWWIVLTAILAFIVHKTRYGNWIFAMGWRQGQRPERRHSDRQADHHLVHPFRDERVFRRNVPGNPVQLGAGLGRHELHLQRDRQRGRWRGASDRRFRIRPRHLPRHADLRGRQPGHLLHRYRPELVEPDHRRDAPDSGRDERELPANGAVLCDAKEEAEFVLTDTVAVALKASAWAAVVFGRFYVGSCQVLMAWWLGLTAVYFLHFSPCGNWRYTMGGRQGKRLECRDSGRQFHDCPLYPVFDERGFRRRV